MVFIDGPDHVDLISSCQFLIAFNSKTGYYCLLKIIYGKFHLEIPPFGFRTRYKFIYKTTPSKHVKNSRFFSVRTKIGNFNMILSAKIWILIIFTVNVKFSEANEMQFERIQLKPMYLREIYNASVFRVAKFNQTAYAVNARFQLYTAIDHNFQAEVDLYQKRPNNNQYTKSALRLPRGPLCNSLDNYYPQYGMKEMKGRSNLPQYEPPTKFCPLKKVNWQ